SAERGAEARQELGENAEDVPRDLADDRAGANDADQDSEADMRPLRALGLHADPGREGQEQEHRDGCRGGTAGDVHALRRLGDDAARGGLGEHGEVGDGREDHERSPRVWAMRWTRSMALGPEW